MNDAEWVELDEALADVRARVVEHEVYARLRDPVALRTFMEHHVWAVWDFMLLATRLQRDLTSVGPVWVPTGDPRAARLINEVKLGEETDELADGSVGSHLQLYVDAMHEVNANVVPILTAVTAMQADPYRDFVATVEDADAPAGAATFVRATTGVALHGSLIEAAAWFTYGREQLIPAMFGPVLEQVEAPTLRYYLQRHVELDGGPHGAAAELLMRLVIERTQGTAARVYDAALKAFHARVSLWDAVVQQLDTITV